jgi:hypothetical protein
MTDDNGGIHTCGIHLDLFFGCSMKIMQNLIAVGLAPGFNSINFPIHMWVIWGQSTGCGSPW